MIEKLQDVTCNAQWTSDCCGKQDLDFGIITADTRYWPDYTVRCTITFMSNYNIQHCVGEDSYFDEVIEPIDILVSPIMKAENEESAKSLARKWYNANVVAALEIAIKIVKGEIEVYRKES